MAWIAYTPFIVLLIFLPKRMMILGAVLVALTASSILLIDQFNRKRQSQLFTADTAAQAAESKRQAAAQAAADALVLMTVAYNPAIYGVEFPLCVTIRNTGTKTVLNASWQFDAIRPGFSSRLIGRHDYDLRETCDKILKPGEAYTLGCKLPNFLPEPMAPWAGTQVSELQWEFADVEIGFDDGHKDPTFRDTTDSR